MSNNSPTLIKQLILVGITLLVVTTIFSLTYQIIKPFLGMLITSIILTIFVNPIFRQVNTMTKAPSLSAFFTVSAVLLFIVIPSAFLGSSLIHETASVLKSVQSNPQAITSLQATIDTQMRSWDIPFALTDFDIKEQVYQVLTLLALNLGNFALQSGAFLLNLFLVLMTVYYLLINQSKILSYFNSLDLFPKRHLALIKSRAIEIVNGTLRGYFLVVLLQLLGGLAGFHLFQIPSAFLLGSLYALSSLFPVVGGFLLWVPVAIWQVATGNLPSAILLSLWFLLLTLVVENILAPKIIGNSTKLHQLIVMFAVFGGIAYFGLLGMVLGPVVVALAFVSLAILKEVVSHKA